MTSPMKSGTPGDDRPPGRRDARKVLQGRVRAILVLMVALFMPGCMYSFQAGAGFPDHVKTVAILPFDNDTTRPEITDEVFALLLREFPRSQGLQPAGYDVADAVVRGTIKSYEISTPSYRATGDVPQVLQRQVRLMVEVEIVNLVDDQVLWQNPGISVQGEYLEEGETEEVGRAIAIDLLVQRIVDGAQSNW